MEGQKPWQQVREIVTKNGFLTTDNQIQLLQLMYLTVVDEVFKDGQTLRLVPLHKLHHNTHGNVHSQTRNVRIIPTTNDNRVQSTIIK